MAEPVLIFFQHFRIFPEKSYRQEKEIVKIHSVHGLQQFLVSRPDNMGEFFQVLRSSRKGEFVFQSADRFHDRVRFEASVVGPDIAQEVSYKGELL
jgi:hypothetical protein